MQACDICRKRKVKCDRHTPCSRCRRLRQPCTYTDVLRKKGPKFVHSYPSIYTPGSMPDLQLQMQRQRGDQASLLAELSGPPGSGTATGTTTASRTGSSSEVGGYSELEMDLDLGLDLGLEFGAELSPVQRPSPFGLGGAESSIMRDLTLYIERLYPLLPVFDTRELRLQVHSHISGAGYSPIRTAFLSSLQATVHAFDFSGTERNYEHERERACERYISEALRARAQWDESQLQLQPQSRPPSDCDYEIRYKLLSSFFLFLAYWNLRREKHAWWYLRECIALLLFSRMNREDEYRRLEPREADSKRRLFWGLFVAERTFCLLHDKPITLRPWIQLPMMPSVFDDEGVMSGFVRLVTLCRGVDVDMSGRWTAAGFLTPITLSPATSAGHDHDGTEKDFFPIQALDLALTREWLRAKTWRLGIPQGRFSEFVASRGNSIWRLDEPVFIGQRLLEILQGPQNHLEELWSGIVDHKLCDICECLYDILPAMQTRGRAGDVDLDQLLRGLLEVLSGFRGRSAFLLTEACT
ncbi:hypothetical protein BJY01DRAFT_258221 [Aspergillus pseudoustus]|uniref:Zn(2)-C6 fungal-type domain-containing protein n=1 Tax=Aspergillus pseudoustus TaxID=1810923 RepID=A0ABR4JCR1_9EURO